MPARKQLVAPQSAGIYKIIGRRAPVEFRKAARKQLDYAGQRIDSESWLGMVAVAALLTGLACSLAVLVLLASGDAFLLSAAFLGGSLLAIVGIYTHLGAQIEDRRNRIERTLPDALHIMAANIRAGMSPLVALRTAARPEFGPLEEEVKYATARSLGTEGITEIFRGISARIPSQIFERSVTLLAASLKGGGKLVELLDRLAEDIREMQELKSELVTSTSLYVLFIIFTVVVGTPLLLAVSYHFTNMVSELQRTENLGAQGDVSGMGLSLVISPPLSQEFVFAASVVVITLTCLLASALIGAIREGSEASGLKYAPFMLVASFLVFYVMKEFVLRFLSVA